MLDFEKLGAFYLGKRYNSEADKLTDGPGMAAIHR